MTFKYDRKEGDKIAQKIWIEKNLEKTPSSWGRIKYVLTDEQHVVINTATEAFQDVYCNTLELYRVITNEKSFFNQAKEIVSRYFAINRHIKIMGDVNRETSGFARGIFALFQAWKDEKKELTSNEKDEIKNELQPLIVFCGDDIKKALSIFIKFMIHIAIRFQFAISIMDTTHEGLPNFAKFFAWSFLEICAPKLNGVIVELYPTDESKVSHIISTLHKSSNFSWKNKEIKLVGEESKWEKFLDKKRFHIEDLLLRSPIEAPILNLLEMGFWYYTGKDRINKNCVLAMPNQFCSSSELEDRQGYYNQSRI